MELNLLAPVRHWEARRALKVARRRADAELLASRLPSPRLAWRSAELVAAGNRVSLARSVTDVVHAADERLLLGASPLHRATVRDCRSELLALASRLCDVASPVAPRGVLLVERLLVDGESPLYGDGGVDRLRAEVARCDEELTARRGAD